MRYVQNRTHIYCTTWRYVVQLCAIMCNVQCMQEAEESSGAPPICAIVHSLPGKIPSPCTQSQDTASNNLTFDCFEQLALR